MMIRFDGVRAATVHMNSYVNLRYLISYAHFMHSLLSLSWLISIQMEDKEPHYLFMGKECFHPDGYGLFYSLDHDDNRDELPHDFFLPFYFLLINNPWLSPLNLNENFNS